MKPLESTKKLKEILKNYYQELYEASKDDDQKVAWCSSIGPAEILVAAGFKVYFPENHGALIGVRRLATKYITRANSLGYSPDICSYLTSDIGAYLLKETPLKDAYGIPEIPKPDILVYSTNQCRELQDWFSFYSREFNVPSIGIFYPWKVDEIKKEHFDVIISQFKSLIKKLEEIIGKKFDYDKFKEVIKLSKEASILWRKFLESARNIPSPITFFDGTIQMAPIVMMRGLKSAKDYYEILLKEVEDRVKNNISAIKNEKIRFYWEGMPVWGKLRFFAELFESVNSNVVASTYCNSWIIDELSEDEPFESMAECYLKIFINRSENIKEKELLNMIQEYKVDAIIFHDAKTCPYNTNTRFGMPERMREKYGIKTLVIYGDLNDLRCFSEEQTKTLIETFAQSFEK